MIVLRYRRSGRVARSLQLSTLENANLERRTLTAIDFRGLNLRGANLRGANLCLSDFEGADLSGADLRGARFRRTDLRRGLFVMIPIGVILAAAAFVERDTFYRWMELCTALVMAVALVGTRAMIRSEASANLTGANLDRVIADETTLWPVGYPTGTGRVQ